MAEAQAIISRLLEPDGPEFFSREILGHDQWETPKQIMRAITEPRARVAVKACHGSSKTFTAAEIVLWWVYTGGIAITTGPTGRQVRKVLWSELHAMYGHSRYPLGGQLNEVELKVSPHCYALGLATDEGVNFQGYHGRVLVVLDEAPGVRPDIYDAIRGIRAGGDVRILALGNPVVGAGPFYDIFTTQRASWTTFSISAFDTPNLAGLTIDDVLRMTPEELDDNPRPYLPTRHWVKEMYQDLGTSSPLYASRVLGQFPLQSEDALLSLSWLEAARHDDEDPTGAIVAGLDVAGPGEDETVLCIRRGVEILQLLAWSQPDPRGAVLAALKRYPGITVHVDSIGIGYYMAQHIRDAGYTVHEVNVGLPASDPEKYANSKAELYWGLRERCSSGMVSGLVDDRAISQLASIRYKHTSRGQIQIESKEDARKRGVHSPDRAEAIMLAFASVASAASAGVWFA